MTQPQAYEELRARLVKMGIHKPSPKALPLPVKYDSTHFFWGKDGEMVADTDAAEVFRIRGWGRIQHMDGDPEALQDEAAEWIAEAINAYSGITGFEILRAIDNECEVFLTEEDGNRFIELHEPFGKTVYLDLTKDPKDYPLETLQWLLEVILDDK